ncbi:hydroxymethylglutaryl-CoA reductase, degradative [Companilactobacillus allii]|uniref:3-hydroxy-3-methylglutaryl coenzyme A reductase n=1 Tax=Companilactobacillus allii TaxID=1847728 RepID=A0A1P8Q2W9_9LACO|nr:hydroxymethylglutaryl-CoA reductase, degradative [Companilactobacillus allii]APX72167.1 hydroxymethylglutaryl-CoA reductase, degradative [Companilactobacillus allii]USQ69264.1 hydroxymethylglutaryl-CoA reductase, degradative [Companilactobacillus allii]
MKLYEMSDDQRIQYLVNNNYIDLEQALLLKSRNPLSRDLSDSLSENQVGLFGLPYGFASDFLINGKDYLVPMSIEEPSVIAAASNGAKRIKNSGGFTVTSSQHIVYGQIVLENTSNTLDILESKRDEILQIIDNAHPSLIKRGGGSRSLEFIDYGDMLEIEIGIDTVDAMGANLVNTILEVTSSEVSKMTSCDVLCSILSNSGAGQVVEVQADVSFDQLATKQMSGSEVADRIIRLNKFAKRSIKRAVTHNKGIMNGIDAVVVASGNDFRAQEAASHEFASQSGKYQPLSEWKLVDDHLHGSLTIPIEVGSVGGAVSSMPMAQLSLSIMKIKNSQELRFVIGSVGLANNLSALRALVTTGIQAGHMSLQSKSLAISAGAIGEEIEKVATELNKQKNYSLANAKKILKELRN